MENKENKEGKVMTKEDLTKSQAEYKGNSHFDIEEVEFIKDSDFYKKGDKDSVHPSVAAIFRAKGIIK